MLVAEIMVEDVVTCDPDATLRKAGKRMLDRGAGSVVVVLEDTPVGILTETDALRAGVATDRPFDDVTVREVASHPVVTIPGDATVRKAVSRMTDEGIKKLPVVEDAELTGIVTRSDVASHYRAFVREAHALEGRREDWEGGSDPEFR
jgi:CBS domain-containing protein